MTFIDPPDGNKGKIKEMKGSYLTD